ncbi:MAG: MFS transporter [Opitutaceae bacterium]|nr:MFS transporter [Opitutaceae bacterium]
MATPPRPRLSLVQIWNMSFGFLGIQFGWGLQMANMSAIYQYLGAKESELAILWLAAPVTGLIVQPIIGYYSDRTWTGLGRRRPYFLAGAILASLALVAMPNSSALWMAAGLLWILDTSVNISMEPFRAFVGDILPPQQRKVGFAMQSLLIGIGAMLSSALPWLLSNVFGMASGASEGGNAIPHTVHVAFYCGAVVYLVAVLVTVFTTREYPPEPGELEHAKKGGVGALFVDVYKGVFEMPKTMKQLSVVQFFTWFGLFCLWLYFTPAISRNLFGGEPGSAAYQAGVEWGGLCMTVYNGIAFVFSFALVGMARSFSAKAIHFVCLLAGALGLVSVMFWTNKYQLLISMVGVGVAWASILSMPYAMLANSIPAERMGFFMGVFNFFIVLPQIVASATLGIVVEKLLGGNSIGVVVAGGVSFLLAALALRFVDAQEAVEPAS